MQETESIDEYILQHIDPESDYLKALYRDTHVKLLRPRMASGHLQGRMLKMFVKMIRPRQILEIGTYSGYSALCLAEGLSEGGMLHTFEINDEQEDFTRPWLEKSPFADKIRFYIGDALELVPDLGVTFDLAFIDGDKRKYIEYYEMTLAHLSEGGYMIADNTLWDGHVLEQPRNTDAQTIGIKAFNDLVQQLISSFFICKVIETLFNAAFVRIHAENVFVIKVQSKFMSQFGSYFTAAAAELSADGNDKFVFVFHMHASCFGYFRCIQYSIGKRQKYHFSVNLTKN